MALLGLSMMLSVRSALNWYLITMLIGFLTGTIFLPLVVVYSPAYIFPLALPILIIAGLSIGRIFKDLRVSSLVVAVTFVIICSLFNLPGVISYFQDGARYNFRSAVRLVQKNWHEGDRVAGFSMGTFRYYAKECCEPRIPLKVNPVGQLDDLIKLPGRLWIVVQYGRNGLQEDLQQWLNINATKISTIKKNRFDYAEYAIDVLIASRIE